MKTLLTRVPVIVGLVLIFLSTVLVGQDPASDYQQKRRAEQLSYLSQSFQHLTFLRFRCELRIDVARFIGKVEGFEKKGLELVEDCLRDLKINRKKITNSEYLLLMNKIPRLVSRVFPKEKRRFEKYFPWKLWDNSAVPDIDELSQSELLRFYEDYLRNRPIPREIRSFLTYLQRSKNPALEQVLTMLIEKIGKDWKVNNTIPESSMLALIWRHTESASVKRIIVEFVGKVCRFRFKGRNAKEKTKKRKTLIHRLFRVVRAKPYVNELFQLFKTLDKESAEASLNRKRVFDRLRSNNEENNARAFLRESENTRIPKLSWELKVMAIYVAAKNGQFKFAVDQVLMMADEPRNKRDQLVKILIPSMMNAGRINDALELADIIQTPFELIDVCSFFERFPRSKMSSEAIGEKRYKERVRRCISNAFQKISKVDSPSEKIHLTSRLSFSAYSHGFNPIDMANRMVGYENDLAKSDDNIDLEMSSSKYWRIASDLAAVFRLASQNHFTDVDVLSGDIKDEGLSITVRTYLEMNRKYSEVLR